MQPVYSVSYKRTDLLSCSCGEATITARFDRLSKEQFRNVQNMFDEIMKNLDNFALSKSEIKVLIFDEENKSLHTVSIYIANKQYLESRQCDVIALNDEKIFELAKEKINQKINQ